MSATMPGQPLPQAARPGTAASPEELREFCRLIPHLDSDTVD